ncbi:unnamed protein product, partial [Prorocentrum cordatum]
ILPCFPGLAVNVKMEFNEHHMSELGRRAGGLSCKGKASNMCAVHGGSCPCRCGEEDLFADPRESPLTMSWGWPRCQAWCPGGGYQGVAHKSIGAFNMWIEEATRFDIVLMEESDQFPVEITIEGMSQTHK